MSRTNHPNRHRRLLVKAIGAAGALASTSHVLAQAGAAPAAPSASSLLAARAVEESKPGIVRISREVWALAELSLAEVKSSQVHMRELEAAGFRITSRGTAGVPTAFVAEWKQGSAGPVIGYLPEYDALPGLGNAAEPRQQPGPTGTASGHGCGHNVLGAACTGGALALKRMMEAERVPGTVRVYGCAAEETEGAKVYMARAGLFDDCDAALAMHPAPFAVTGLVRTAATNNVKVSFRGATAHAGNSPWEGRSALKAAELFGAGVQNMREHVLPTARLHYMYEAAGVAPNVVPDFAKIWIVIRDVDRDKVTAMTDWIRQIADGAALMTQTKAEFDLFFGMYDLLPNEPLARLMYQHLQAVPLEWTAEEQAFARSCQRAMKVKEDGMTVQALPFMQDITAGGSTDVGDVSYLTPCGLFGWPTVPLNVGLHTWPVTATGGMSIGDKGALNSARILAAAGFDLMTDAKLREAAKADFLRRRGDRPFVSPLPTDRQQPLGLPEFLRKTNSDELFSTVKSGA